jgi:hypothetical protein
LAFCKLNTGDSLELLDILINIPQDYAFTPDQMNTHKYYEDLFDIIILMKADSARIDSTTYPGLFSLINETNEIPGIYSRNLLITLDLFKYNEPIYLPNNAYKTLPVKHKSHIQGNSLSQYLKVFPNPAGNYFIAQYDLTGQNDHGLLIISDISGKNIKAILLKDKLNQIVIPIEKIAQGAYLIKLYCGKGLLDSDKLIITK